MTDSTRPSDPGRTSRMTISSVNDTIGDHDGEAIAAVSASETPITMPATSGPTGEPSPPSITAAIAAAPSATDRTAVPSTHRIARSTRPAR